MLPLVLKVTIIVVSITVNITANIVAPESGNLIDQKIISYLVVHIFQAS